MYLSKPIPISSSNINAQEIEECVCVCVFAIRLPRLQIVCGINSLEGL